MSDGPFRDGLVPEEWERHRVELTGYCYRMLGSPFDAEDAVQETVMRAWRSRSSFDRSRSSVRTWLYTIATNLCFDTMKSARRRRELSVGHGPRVPVGPDLGTRSPSRPGFYRSRMRVSCLPRPSARENGAARVVRRSHWRARGPVRRSGRTCVQVRDVASDATVATTNREGEAMIWVCSHYRCRRTDVAPVVYWVLGFEFLRILCPEHQPQSRAAEEGHREAA